MSCLRNCVTRCGDDQFEIVPWHALADFYNKTVALYTKQIQGMRLIIALIILLSITNTMTMSVMERIGEIGTSMALGVKRSGIVRLFLSEGILIGCVGGVLGLLLGLILAWHNLQYWNPHAAPSGHGTRLYGTNSGYVGYRLEIDGARGGNNLRRQHLPRLESIAYASRRCLAA